MGCSSCLLRGKERTWWAWGAGFYLVGPAGGKLRQDARVPFLSSPRRCADSSVASVESFRSPSWYFSTHKTRGLLPSPPRLWLPAVMAAVCPRDTAPLQPPPRRRSLTPSDHRTRLSGMGWQQCSRCGTTSPDAQMLPLVHFPSELPALLRAFASALGLGLIFGGFSFGNLCCWQAGICRELLSSSKQFAAA